MKKFISLTLCLALVFSVCSLGLTVNAANRTVKKYLFNNNTLEIDVYTTLSSGSITIYFRESDESVYFDPELINEYGTGDLEYIVEDFLLERLTDSQIKKIDTLYFTRYSKVESRLDENDFVYIISKLNPSNLKYFSVSSDKVEDMSSIVDALLGCCKNTLSLFSVAGESKITEIDNRVFTDFPNMKTVLLEGIDIISYSDCPISITNDYYGYPTFYAVVPESIFDTDDADDYLKNYYYQNIYPYYNGPNNVSTNVNISNFTTAYTVHFYEYNGFKAKLGQPLYGILVVSGDATGDQYVDSFDVATATEYVNTFEEPEDPAVKVAMDIVEDGYIDATDLAYITYIANFEE